MRLRLLALLGLVVLLPACGGGGDATEGTSIELSALGLDAQHERGRWLTATCPPGRLTVDFRPGDELTIEGESRVVSLSPDRATVGCEGARLVEPARVQLWRFERFTPLTPKATRLVCVTSRSVDVVVHAVYANESELAGGAVVLSDHGASGTPQALLSATVREEGSDLGYHVPRCEVEGGG